MDCKQENPLQKDSTKKGNSLAGKMELFLEFTGKLSTGGHSEARQGLCWGVSLSKGHTLPVITPRLLQWLVSAAFSHRQCVWLSQSWPGWASPRSRRLREGCKVSVCVGCWSCCGTHIDWRVAVEMGSWRQWCREAGVPHPWGLPFVCTCALYFSFYKDIH